jgi:hypothetical protein
MIFWCNINLFRIPAGKGMETFGEDPFLTGKSGENSFADCRETDRGI